MSKVIKLHKGETAADGRKAPPPRMASLPKSDDFVSFEDAWHRSGEKSTASSPGGPTAQSVREIRDPRELARQQAEELIKQAQAESSRIEKEAYDKGFSQGEAAGRAEGKKEFEALSRQFEVLVQALEQQRQKVNEQYERDLMTLVKTMVERLVYHEVSVNPLVIQACLRKAMEFVVENSLVKVHLNPDDFHRVKEAGLSDPSLLEGKNRVQLIEDPSVSAGGCLLQTDFGEIDATLENSRDKLYEAVDRAFLAALAADSSSPQEGPVGPGPG